MCKEFQYIISALPNTFINLFFDLPRNISGLYYNSQKTPQLTDYQSIKFLLF